MLPLLFKSNRRFLPTNRFFSQPKVSPIKGENTGIHEEPHEPNRDLIDFKYPLFVPNIALSQFVVDFENLAHNDVSEKEVSVAGRVQSKRMHSSVAFIVIKQDQTTVQVKLHPKNCQNYEGSLNEIRKGDVVSVEGKPHRTIRGEISVLAEKVTLLSPSHHSLPDWNSLLDSNIRYRQRYLDMLVNKQITTVLRKRAQIINYLRQYLNARQFVEVETPSLSPSAGGAIANPFLTYSKSLGASLSMRIAPELYLKQLVVGGLDRVYELGKVFRNEGVDKSHNPEFTSCEFYQAYSDYNQLMDFTEELLRSMAFEINGTHKVTIDHPDQEGQKLEIDFSLPFKRISVVEGIETKIGQKLKLTHPIKELSDQLHSICSQYHISIQNSENGQPSTPSQLLDKLIGHFIEPETVQPTFLMDHPILLSPLARNHREKPGVTERFELFIGTMELCNAYTELNDPNEQRKRFKMQEDENNLLGIFKSEATKESEEEYCTALDYGLPPTGGWGMGIDRLVMILTGHANIRDVIAFPMMKSNKHDKNENEGTKEKKNE
jgi:lysyl-tRNA synthetase class 2